MTSKERVYRTLDFETPDRIPVDLWILPAAEAFHGEALQELLSERGTDFIKAPFHDPTADAQMYDEGVHTDIWGSVWHSRKAGMAGEVKGYPLEDDEAFRDYRSPLHVLEDVKESDFYRGVDEYLGEHADMFVHSGWMSLFERMQFLRGTENLFMDIALETDEFFKLRDMVLAYWLRYTDLVCAIPGVDACTIGDDWGSQKAMLISPAAWRKLFKPAYKQLINRIHQHGKRAFIHSDGYILDIYEDWIELGADAINSQIWCMGPEKVAQIVKGRITCWGELSRQTVLPFGTPEDIQQQADEMKRLFYQNGGLIGQCETGYDVPLANIRAALNAW